MLFVVILCEIGILSAIETSDDTSCADTNSPTLPQYDDRFTVFVHSSIRVSYINDDKQQGLIVTEDIPIGTVLIVEDPWMHTTIDSSSDKYPYFKSKLAIINAIRQDDNIYKLYTETLAINNKMKDMVIGINKKYDNILNINTYENNRDINDLAVFETNSWGSSMYGLLSKLNYGYPTNIVIFGGNIKNNKNNRIIIIATDSISKNQELVYEYFDVFGDNSFERKIEGYGITLDSSLNLNELRNKYLNKINDFLSGSRHDKSFATDIAKIYKNCITNWWVIPGGDCDKNLDSTQKDIKRSLMFLISHANLMEYAHGNKEPQSWMGDEFIAKMEYTANEFML